MARPTRVLYVANGHPRLSRGGVEVFSLELFRGMRSTDEYEPILLARTISPGDHPHQGTPFRALDQDPNQILWYQSRHNYLWMTSLEKDQVTVHFRDFLEAYRPHLVHFQHTIGLGIDLIRQVRNTLPGAPIVYTLHEFLPICHAAGLLLRTDGQLCAEASPTRCNECFPEIPAEKFFLREQFVKRQFALVDLFLAPSHQLLEKYLHWGIPADKIRFQEYGRLAPTSPDDKLDEEPPVGNIGFFGQVRQHKGILPLLEAMRLLAKEKRKDIHLFLSGANLEAEKEEFQRRVQALLQELPNVTFLGEYDPREISDRMRNIAWVVVPSLWWENSPLVIQEAFMHRRPVICGDIGGMAEKVTHRVDGLHFRVGDAFDLAAAFKAAAARDLWLQLRKGIQPVYPMRECVAAHTAIYHSLLNRSTSSAGDRKMTNGHPPA